MDDQNFYLKIIDNMFDGVYFVDTKRRIIYWNKAAERISGFPAGRVENSFCYDNLLNHVTETGVQLCHKGCPLQATIEDGKRREAEIFLHHADGHRVPVLIRTSPLQDGEGKNIGAIEVFSDNSSLFSTRRRVRRLEESVMLDPLTGIGNRRYMEAKIQAALAEFQQHRIPFGVLFIDIDYFKQVNDTYGHNFGDKVLRLVATTLMKNVRPDDSVARWGGEEFVVLLADIDMENVIAVAEKLRVLVKGSALPYSEGPVSVTISIGGTMIRFEDDSLSLLHRADDNMYKSKLAGRNRLTYDPPAERSSSGE